MWNYLTYQPGDIQGQDPKVMDVHSIFLRYAPDFVWMVPDWLNMELKGHVDLIVRLIASINPSTNIVSARVVVSDILNGVDLRQTLTSTSANLTGAALTAGLLMLRTFREESLL